MWHLTNGFTENENGRAGRYTNMDQWRASYCAGLDLSTDACVSDRPSSFVPPPLPLPPKQPAVTLLAAERRAVLLSVSMAAP